MNSNKKTPASRRSTKHGTVLTAAFLFGTVFSGNVSAQTNLNPFYLEPPKFAQAQFCWQRKVHPTRSVDWLAWRGEPLPVEISGEEIIAIADQFATGIGPFAQDQAQAERLLRYVLDNDLAEGTSMARVRLSQIIIEDVTKPREERERAVTSLRSEVDKGIPEALFTMGRVYEIGRLGEPDYNKAFEFYRKSALVGNSSGLYAAARLAKLGRVRGLAPNEIEHTTLQSLVGMFEELGRGNCRVLMQIASVYASAELGPRNEKLAARWYEAALEADNLKAAEILAEYHRTGFGVEQSATKYVAYLQRAAEAGLPSAMLRLGSAYVTGDSLPQDRAKAKLWLARAVRGGRVDGLKWMLHMYSGKFGGLVDEPAVIQVGEQMIQMGIATPQDKYLVGSLYTGGKPESRNVARGLTLLEEAASLEEARAAKLLGELYLSGSVEQRDLPRAMRYFRQAALLGDVDAMDVVSNVLQCTQQADDARPVAKAWRNTAAFLGSGSERRRYADENFDANDAESKKSRARFYRAAALDGDREAAAIVAHLYLKGEGLPASQEGHEFFMAKALRPGEGLADGYIALAQIHLDGKLVPVDRNKAIELLQQAAALPSGRAHFELSRLLAETGLGDEKSILNHLRQAVELNHPPAIRTLALRLTGEARELGRTREEWLQVAAKGGDMRSGIELALNGDGPASIEAALDRIWEGQSCKPDQMLELALAYAKLKTPTAASKAYRWLRRAEIYGNDSASHYYSMASAYLSGLRAHADPSRAEALLRRAHELGHPRALRRLASAYLDGDIPSGNREEASRILKEAAQQGHVDAALKLIEIDIEASPGGRLSPEKAKEIQRLFALIMPQSVEATREFGLLILKGHFADLKTDTAIALIRRAAETGDTIAMRELGNAYANGLGVERRPDQFVRWISQAASKGDAEAMFKLSAAYEAGFGVEPNRSEAERWITEARRAGGPSSKLH